MREHQNKWMKTKRNLFKLNYIYKLHIFPQGIEYKKILFAVEQIKKE